MEKGIGELLDKLKRGKKNQWLIVALVGVLILVIAIPVPKKEETQKVETIETTVLEENGQMETLERRLEGVLRKVAGVGKVNVMITRKSSGEKVVEKDRPVTDGSMKEEDGETTSRSTTEKTLEEATVFVQDGQGGQMPYVKEELEPEIQGVIVVAEGGNDPKVIRNITEAVMALFDVEAHKIKVMKMN